MAEHGHLYLGGTTGGTDGTQVSEGGAQTNPISQGPLDLTINQVGTPVKVQARSDSGYKTEAGSTVTPTGTHAAKWRYAPDSAGSPGTWQAYAAAFTFAGEVLAVNSPVWMEAKATSDENPQNDVTVSHVWAGTWDAV